MIGTVCGTMFLLYLVRILLISRNKTQYNLVKQKMEFMEKNPRVPQGTQGEEVELEPWRG